MGIVTPRNKEVPGYRGLHLFHAGISHCSMRVRMTLEEKRAHWTSHHLDIINKEHVTPEYLGIHPNGQVPALVDDGLVIVESEDIIDHIDRKFPMPPLRPYSDSGLEKMYSWLQLASNIHVNGVITYLDFNPLPTTIRKREHRGANVTTINHQCLSEADLDNAKTILTGCFSEIENVLKQQDWLVESRFSLADIMWVPLHFKLQQAEFSFQEYPAIENWAARISERQSFRKAIMDWWPGDFP